MEKYDVGMVVDLVIGDIDIATSNFSLLIKHLKHIESWGQEAREFSVKYFANDNIAKTYLNKYEEISS